MPFKTPRATSRSGKFDFILISILYDRHINHEHAVAKKTTNGNYSQLKIACKLNIKLQITCLYNRQIRFAYSSKWSIRKLLLVCKHNGTLQFASADDTARLSTMKSIVLYNRRVCRSKCRFGDLSRLFAIVSTAVHRIVGKHSTNMICVPYRHSNSWVTIVASVWTNFYSQLWYH